MVNLQGMYEETTTPVYCAEIRPVVHLLSYVHKRKDGRLNRLLLKVLPQICHTYDIGVGVIAATKPRYA